MADDRGELLQGTLEMLVLKTLALEPMHGWGIAHRIEHLSSSVFLVTQGSLYPALVRMKRRGWLRTSWAITENNRRARYYALTPAGHARTRSGTRQLAPGICRHRQHPQRAPAAGGVMSVISDLLARLRSVAFHRREERELAEELRAHVEMEADHLRQRGVSRRRSPSSQRHRPRWRRTGEGGCS